jgi:AcrR family transcriptional regulator
MISPHWRSSEEILSSILDRREERAERRTAHIGELRKRAAETDAKLKRLYDAIENGVADLADPMLKDRIAELKARRNGRPPPGDPPHWWPQKLTPPGPGSATIPMSTRPEAAA